MITRCRECGYALSCDFAGLEQMLREHQKAKQPYMGNDKYCFECVKGHPRRIKAHLKYLSMFSSGMSASYLAQIKKELGV